MRNAILGLRRGASADQDGGADASLEEDEPADGHRDEAQAHDAEEKDGAENGQPQHQTDRAR